MTFTVKQVTLNLKCITYFEGFGDFNPSKRAGEWLQAVRSCNSRPLSYFNDLSRYNISTGAKEWTGITRRIVRKWSGSGYSIGGQYYQTQKISIFLHSSSRFEEKTFFNYFSNQNLFCYNVCIDGFEDLWRKII